MHRCLIVVPCYNEAARIDGDHFTQFARNHRDIEFVMVNDGSTDNTLDVLNSLATSVVGSFHVLDLAQNCGKAEAVRRGTLYALDTGADFTGYWDADLATPLEDILTFRSVLQGDPRTKLVLGSRVRLLGHEIDRKLIRHLLGRVFATAAAMVLRMPVYDTQCGAKLLRAGTSTRRLFATPFRTGWIFDVEMLARFRRTEASGIRLPEAIIREVPVRSWRDVPGSKVRPSAFVKSVFALMSIAWNYRGTPSNLPSFPNLHLPNDGAASPTQPHSRKSGSVSQKAA